MKASSVYLARPTMEQANWLAENLRPADRHELAALCGEFTPDLARALLADCLRRSAPAFAICAGGELLALSGAIPLSPAQAAGLAGVQANISAHIAAHISAKPAAPWLLGTAGIKRHKLGFMRASRQALRRYLAHYSHLCNAVGAGQSQSCRYLAALGFALGPPRRLGNGFFRTFNLEV